MPSVEFLAKIKELQAENEQLKKDLEHARSYKHTIKMRNRNLQTENERLNTELKNEKYSHERIREVKDVLKAENEQLKRELKQTEAQDQVVIDGLSNENARLRCTALHAMGKYFDAVRVQYDMQINRDDFDFGNHVNKDVEKRDDYKGLAVRYKEAYRKAKAKLMSSNG